MTGLAQGQRVTDPLPLFAEGARQLQASDLQAAEASYQRLIELLPNSADAKNGLAMVYVGRNEWYRARDLLESVVQMEPTHRTSWANLGEIYLHLAQRAYSFAAQNEPAGIPARRLAGLKTALGAAPSIGPSASAATVQAGTEAVFNAWLAAWQARDAESYLANYASDFVPAGGQTFAAWKAARQRALAAASHLAITADSPRWESRADGRLIVSYREHLRANGFQRKGVRRLTWMSTADGWRIEREEFSAQ
jgi:tetratricopeptide (TPR) repeat protein